MGLRLLRCLVFAFAYVVGTCGVSVLADDPDGCDVGKYFDGTECKNCPNYSFIQQTYSNYFFIHSGGSSEGVSSCAIRLSGLDSKCDVRETDVVYKYDETEGKYNLDTLNYNVVPKDNCYKLYESVNDISGIVDDHCSDECPAGKYADTSDKTCKSCPLAGTNADGKVGDGNAYPYEFVSGEDVCRIRLKSNTGVSFEYDNATGNYEHVTCPNNSYKLGWVDKADLDNTHCGECDVDEGYYTSEEDEKTCYKCPTNENIGSGKRFNFINHDDGKAVGITSCAVKLDVSKDSCSSASNVVYKYSNDTHNYIRTEDSFIYPTARSVTVIRNVDDMTNPFCVPCENDKYNVGNTCIGCDAGYYLKTEESIEMCSACPAGYYCPGKTNDAGTSQKVIQCKKDTYSEGGTDRCTPCAPGYSTASSGPATDGEYDGLCLNRQNGFGVGCISPAACKLTMSFLSVSGASPFSLGNNVKIQSLNQSVVQSIKTSPLNN